VGGGCLGRRDARRGRYLDRNLIVLPLFGEIWKRGAGFGSAITSLLVGAAANILALTCPGARGPGGDSDHLRWMDTRFGPGHAELGKEKR